MQSERRGFGIVDSIHDGLAGLRVDESSASRVLDNRFGGSSAGWRIPLASSQLTSVVGTVRRISGGGVVIRCALRLQTLRTPGGGEAADFDSLVANGRRRRRYALPSSAHVTKIDTHSSKH